MEPFQLQSAPLGGVTLIEAGAGTGKTYTLAGLVLRLIVEQGLGIEQILVVTYTKAATEELKTRIRDRLNDAKHAFNGVGGSDEVLAALVEQHPDPESVRQRIEDALTNFDRAAIFTIHGFCQRLLQHYAFETGHLFQSELVQDRDHLVHEMVEDFWRRHIVSAPYELARFALQHLKGPDQLSRIINYCAYPHVKLRPEGLKPAMGAIAPWRKEADRLLRQWSQAGEQVLHLLKDPGLNARYYGKCEPDPSRSPHTYRQLRLLEFATRLDSWNGKYPLDGKLLKYLGASLIKKYTKKGHTVPDHPFFETCDRTLTAQALMEKQMERYLRYLKIRLLQQAREVLDRKKRHKNIYFFDDLLLYVHSALQSEQGADLAAAVRSQYQAALVDEFQDTDLVQYEIFQRLFGRSPQLLFMIGDPKQAIYSFRGADLFSYLKAADSAQRCATLTRNWRSTPTLVKAVNTLFEGHPSPFGFEQIQFNPAVAARPDRTSGPSPMTLWYLTRTEGDAASKPTSQEDATNAIAAAVAEEIVRLLNAPREGIAPGQIAVLTRKHTQSQIIKQALAKKHVPAVLHSAGSVFDTAEAEALLRVLAALADPHDPGKVRAALAQDMFDLNAADFHRAMEAPDHMWQERWSSFHHDHQVWIRRGVYPMLRTLMMREKVKSRLLCRPDGERRLTNVLHLAELLHEAESEHGLGPDGVVKWLVSQRQTVDEADEKQLRLESDAHAVRIITMHKSKGLQFDVVFCPFTWGGVRMDKNAAVFHDPGDENLLTLTLGPDIPAEQQLEARKELLAENLRMLYVALTRAKERCYMVWGRINGTELSAPAYLFHGSKIPAGRGDWLSPLAQRMKSLSDKGLIDKLRLMARRSKGSMQIAPLPRPTDGTYRSKADSRAQSNHRVLRRQIAGHWPMASFSSLTAAMPNEADAWPDRDNVADVDLSPEAATGEYTSLFDFPKGAHAGLFFHDLLEHWDHTGKHPRRQDELIQAKLHTHGFDAPWHAAIDGFLNQLSGKVLKTPDARFSLSQVRMDQRINEMEFYYRLKRFSPEQIKQCFDRSGDPRLREAVAKRLERISFAPEHGFMKGFIDTVFEYGHQFFLVDWKSNHLGSRLEAYDPRRLEKCMVDDDYFLQYHLYAVALNRLLEQKIEGYRYNRHFGGVFYVFLRGITDEPLEGSGLYYAKPEGALISALDRLMIAAE